MSPDREALATEVWRHIDLYMQACEGYGNILTAKDQLTTAIDALAAPPDAPELLTEDQLYDVRYILLTQGNSVEKDDFDLIARAVESEVRSQFGVKI